MPITYNGIGTHYYGHKNSQKRPAACHSCGRSVQLESYDTRLWFVVVFIPVIPLGRKRIIDQCPVCKRHYVADANKWETQKQLNVSGAMEEYLADPTPEKAMVAHQQLINFHQTVQAADFRREIAEKFRQNAKLQAYLGQALLATGMAPDAAVYFQRALELRPDLPEARVGMAREHIRAGRLTEARSLLDFLEKPGAAQLYSLEPLETLANAYQRAGQHEPALELYRCLVEALPAVGEVPHFRKRVTTSEKALRRKETILPKWKFSWKRFLGRNPDQQRRPGSVRITWRGLAIAAAVVAIFVGLISLHGVYQRHHRELFIVNAFKEPATVEVRGAGTVRVPPGHGWEKLVLAEGRYHVAISGPVRQELEIDVETNGSVNHPVWLLNVGGAALLVEKRVTYQASNPPPPEVIPHFGQAFEEIDRLSHPFTSLPTSISMNSNEGQRVLTNLDFSEVAPDDLLVWLQLRARNSEAARLAEWQLKFHPEDTNALDVFGSLGAPKHVEEILQAGLRRRPVEMPWHRAYQNLRGGPAWFEWLAAAYDGMLKDEPGNSALLYLRGRVATDPTEATKWFTRARDADPQNPFPYYALGYDHLSTGDWAGARPLFARAAELNPAGPGFVDALFTTRLALEEYAALEKEQRNALVRQPLDIVAKMRLIELLLAQARPTEARQIIAGIQEQARKSGDAGLATVATNLTVQYLYLAGDFPALAQLAAKDRTPTGRTALFMALLEQGKIAEALRAQPLDKPEPNDAYIFLTVSLAWMAAQDQPQAENWLGRAVQRLQQGTPDEMRAATLFSKNAALTPEALEAIRLDGRAKAIVLTALGMFHPEQHQDLYAAARRLNVDRHFPYHLLQRITGDAH